MKLSEMNTEQLSVCLCRLAGPVERIGQDEDINDCLRKIANDPGATMLRRVSGMAGALIPVLLDKHREDTFLILSALTGKSVDAIKEQNGMQTIREMRACFDGELLDFFKSSGDMDAGK